MTKDIAKATNRTGASGFPPSNIGYLQDPARPVLGHGRSAVAGDVVPPHSHPRSQLLWAMQGVLRVTSEGSVWIVPPSHAVWIPGDTMHDVLAETDVELRNLYVDPSLPLRRTPPHENRCAVLLLTPLLRELILKLTRHGAEAPQDARMARLSAVAADEIEALVEAPFSLPGGHDPRLLRLTRHLRAHPDDRRPLTELAAIGGASPRTLERLFRNETGLTFRQWRSRLRLLASIELLDRGQSSTRIAYALGYRSPSAFVAAFREQFGRAPQSFLQG